MNKKETNKDTIRQEETQRPEKVILCAANAYARYGPSMAAAVIMMLPPILIFVLLQRQVIETMTSAGIKG